MSSVFDDVHYYVCLWRTESCTDTSGFDGMDLRHAELVEPSQMPGGIPDNSWTGPSWQSQRCHRAMRRAAIGYDLVVDTRTDILVEASGNAPSVPSHQEVHSTRLRSEWPGSHLPGMEDHLFVTDPRTCGIWSRRHELTYEIAYNHCILWRYCEDMGLVPRQLGWLDTEFVRPNWIRQGGSISVARAHEANKEWNAMDRVSRLRDCVDCGIDPVEYSADYHIGVK